MYDFQLDEDNNGYSEDVPSIAKFAYETGIMSSQNILLEREDVYVEIAKANGTMG